MGFISRLFGSNNDSTNGAGTNQQDFNGRINQSQQGLQGSLDDQNALAKQLLAQNNGSGPNPALAQLNETTGQNIKNTGALIAGQKGLNPGLAAKLAADQGANTQQAAVGQAATMRAQQILQNQGQLQNIYGNIGQQNLQNQGIQQQAQAQQNSLNAGVAGQNAGTNANIGGGIVNGIASYAGMSGGKWEGGEIEGHADGGLINGKTAGTPSVAGTTAISGVDTGIPQYGLGNNPFSDMLMARKQSATAPTAMAGNDFGSPTPMQSLPMQGGPVMMAKDGGPVPGKPMVEGDSPSNDTVPAMLSPGEIVIPRTAAKSPESAKKFVEQIKTEKTTPNEDKAAEFLAAVKAHKIKASPSAVPEPTGYSKMLMKHRELDQRLAKLENVAKMLSG